MNDPGNPYPTLLRKRNFSEVFDDFGRFVRTASIPFLKVLLYVPGPFILLTGLFSAFGGFLSIGSTPDPSLMSIPLLLITLLLSFFTYLLSLGSGIVFLKRLEEDGETPSPKTVRDEVFSKFGDLFIGLMAWVGLFLVFFFFIGLFFGLMAVPAGGSGALIFLTFLIFMILLLIMPPISFHFTASFFGMLRDGLSFGKAFSKGWRMISMAFWKAWSVTIVGMLLMMFLSFACMIPEGVFAGIYSYMSLDLPSTGLSGYIMSALSLLRYFATQILGVFFVILHGLLYYSLHEMESGEALLRSYDESSDV